MPLKHPRKVPAAITTFSATGKFFVQRRLRAQTEFRKPKFKMVTLRAFSGVTVGIIGGVIGIHRSLGFSAIALLVVTASLLRSPVNANHDLGLSQLPPIALAGRLSGLFR